jgi:hypothetical protein
MKASVHTPYYDWDGRKYLEILLDDSKIRVKVPWRYGRVMCRVEGLKTIQELQKGDEVEVTLERKTWDGLEHWVLSSIKT